MKRDNWTASIRWMALPCLVLMAASLAACGGAASGSDGGASTSDAGTLAAGDPATSSPSGSTGTAVAVSTENSGAVSAALPPAQPAPATDPGTGTSSSTSASLNRMVVSSFTGPVTRSEIASFKAYIATLAPAADNIGNNWAQGTSGEQLKAMGMV